MLGMFSPPTVEPLEPSAAMVNVVCGSSAIASAGAAPAVPGLLSRTAAVLAAINKVLRRCRVGRPNMCMVSPID